MFTNLTKSIAWQLLVQNNSDIIMALYSKWGSTVALINRNYTRVVVSNVFGTNCTGELFLWVVRWTSHSIAVSFNMEYRGRIGTRSSSWYWVWVLVKTLIQGVMMALVGWHEVTRVLQSPCWWTMSYCCNHCDYRPRWTIAHGTGSSVALNSWEGFVWSSTPYT